MSKRFLALAVSAISVTAWAPAAAESYYVSSDGVRYSVVTNEHGAVLTSTTPVARSSGGRSVEAVETLYFGNDCDAFHDLYGTGVWSWANAGFSIEFDGLSVSFPRQDPPTDEGLDCGMWGR